MELSILIINWNTRDHLAECLSSVYESSISCDYEVLVVDNCSSDGSQEMVRERFPDVKLILNPENPGFAKANNQALKQSTGELVLLLNPDTVVKPDAIERMVNFLVNSSEAGGAGAHLLNPDGSFQVSAYPQPTLIREFWRMFHFDYFWHYAIYPMDRWSLDQPRKVDVLTGACLLIRRDALDEVGFLDDDFYIYSEEFDLCKRLKDIGWTLYWIPDAEVIHFGGQSTKQVDEAMFLRLYEGKILYFRKHHSNLEVSLYKFILLLATLARLALTPIAFFEHPTKRRKHLDLSHHYRRLLLSLPGL